ncbi:MAG TPA: ABC transporter substrate-binding protein [Candidatus Desulfobacillus sp.]|nr:ABC transporter substrate-binding protein [Candidatus Desulfobacillus sp.]
MRGLYRLLGGCLLAAILLSSQATGAAERLPKLVLTGPFAAVSFPLIHMVESGALKDVAETVEFVAWKNPDQLRAMAIDGKMQADFLATPSSVAANLHNRGVRLRLINVSVWGMLWLVSRDANAKTLADFKGREIVMPFRADMPDIIFQTLAEKAGLDPKRDFRLRYVASPFDAMQLMITRRADHVVLSEPGVSMALRKTKSFPVSLIAPELHRSVDLQKEWGRLFNRPPRMPQAGIAVMGRALDNPALVERFQQAYAASLKWCQAAPEACGAMVARHIDILTPEAVADAVRSGQADFVTAREARPELEFFYSRLLERQPQLIGGRLPPDDFYYGGK